LPKANLPTGATMAPVIIGTDKTQLTQFSGGKSAYPVYLTIGNLPKAIRRKPTRHACILIAYLSVDKLDRSTMTDIEHRSRVHRMFHESMKTVLEPLKEAGMKGVEMEGSNGEIRLVFPILSCYVADYPEQCLVTCSKSNTCPKCQATADDFGNPATQPRRTHTWTESIIREGQEKSQDEANPLHSFYKFCQDKGVSGGVYDPFWSGFPHTDIFRSVTPDILHQLYQGIVKHLIGWCQKVMDAKELDRRIRCLPKSHGVRHFKNGITALSQISGSERKDMAKILLGCLVGRMAPSGIRAVKAILDFVYLAQYPTHDDITLKYMADALTAFHRWKDFFVKVGCRENWKLPKLHSLVHYIESIELYGTTDNYNTEAFERFHIDFAKHGWRATNHRDEFPQMIRWLSRQEKLGSLSSLISKRQQEINLGANTSSTAPRPHSTIPRLHPGLPLHPTFPNRHIAVIERFHHTPHFTLHLKRYLKDFVNHPIPLWDLEHGPLPFNTLDTYNILHLRPEALHDDDELVQLIRAVPEEVQGNPPGRFDTIIATVKDGMSTSVEGE
jgi:hypothetical protein